MENLDLIKLQEVFTKINPEQRDKMLETMSRVLTAVKLNDDEDFVNDVYEEYLFKDFPLLRDIIQKGQYRK